MQFGAIMLTTVSRHLNFVHDRYDIEAPAAGQELTWQLVGRNDPQRDSLEAFIAEVFWQRYRADIEYFAQHLIGCKNVEGAWVAAAGYSSFVDRDVFLEQYFDDPVTHAVAAAVATSESAIKIERSDLVEVSNLVATFPGGARWLIRLITAHLHSLGLRWVLFTATHELLNAFRKVGYSPVVLTKADPMRLASQGKSWGTYYANSPEVVCADCYLAYERMYASSV